MGSIIQDNTEVFNQLGIDPAEATALETALVNQGITRAEGAIKTWLKYDPVQRERTEFYPQHTSMFGHAPVVLDVNATEAYEQRLGHGRASVLQVQHIPIRVIAEVYIDYDGRAGTQAGSFSSETLKSEGSDYWAIYDVVTDSGRACRSGLIQSIGIWPEQAGAVKIKYTAGYTAAEFAGSANVLDASPIAMAVALEASRRAKEAFLDAKNATGSFTAGTIASERLGDYSYTLGSSSGASGGESGRKYGGVNALLPGSKEMLSDFVNYGWSLHG